MKSIKWDYNVMDTVIKRPCECQGCRGCKQIKECNIFGIHYCQRNECNEWRCDRCFDKNKNVCNYCLRR